MTAGSLLKDPPIACLMDCKKHRQVIQLASGIKFLIVSKEMKLYTWYIYMRDVLYSTFTIKKSHRNKYIAVLYSFRSNNMNENELYIKNKTIFDFCYHHTQNESPLDVRVHFFFKILYFKSLCKMFNAESDLLAWIKERESVREKKEAGANKPWTENEIIRDYKFCNVRREDDSVTRWIFENWLMPNTDSPNIVFAMCMARHFNWPDTLLAIGFPHVWEPERIRQLLKCRRDEKKLKIYTGAYTISTGGLRIEKIDYSIDHVLTPLWQSHRLPKIDESLVSYWTYLQQKNGFGSFMAGQVIADLKFIPPLKSAPDWATWAPLGPGSIRGLNRYHGRKLTAAIKQSQGVIELRQIQELIKQRILMNLSLHNVQNCMCEFDKYMRLKYDNGHVRSKYNGRN